jgi:hypothetical protein
MHAASPVAAADDVKSSDTHRRTHQTAANEVIVVLCTRRRAQPHVTSRGRIQADENHSYRSYSARGLLAQFRLERSTDADESARIRGDS